MSEESGPNAAQGNVRKARLSTVWVIPILAIALAGYLGYRTLSEKGPMVTIYFETGDGLEAGKTPVKYKSVEIGTVSSIDVRAEDPQIVVQCQLNKKATPHVVEGSEFWVVRPRIGMSGVSGLGTLLSGAYIDFVPGPPEAKGTNTFVGLESLPAMRPDDPRLRVILHTPDLGSLDAGDPVYYRKIIVGEIGNHSLSKDGKSVEIEVLIDPDHASLLRKGSRFWNSGGIDLSLGLGKADVKTESLAAMLMGGVAFDSPGGGEPAEKDSKFVLHESRSKLEEAAWLYGGLHVVVEASQSGGVKDGDFVYYKEQRVGSVVSTGLSNDSRVVRIHLNILSRYAPLVRTNSVFWNASGISADLGLTGLHIHAESLEALLAGGIAFATPNSPGGRVKSGSVFRLHPEVKDDWLKWSPTVSRGAAQKHAGAGSESDGGGHGGIIASFFHHKDKSESEAAGEEHPKDSEKHGFFHRMFH